MCPAYPYFGDTPSFPGVKVEGLSKEAQQSNAADLHRLIRMAHDRGTPIPEKYTCSAKGTAVSMPLAWTEPRPGTVSSALLFHDLEAVMHKGTEDVTHWMTWNIPADVRGLPKDFRPYRPILQTACGRASTLQERPGTLALAPVQVCHITISSSSLLSTQS